MKKVRGCGLLGFFFVFLCALSVNAAVQVQLFDQTFTRETGKPFQETATFPSGNGQVFIKVYNCGQDKTADRISSAVITINGNIIYNQSQFSQKISYLEKNIFLPQGQNTLSVSLNSKPGGMIRIQITQTVEAEAAAVIGPQGGVVEVINEISPIFGTKLIIPDGALQDARVVSLSILASESNLPGYKAGELVEIRPNGTKFVNPAILQLKYNDADNDGIIDGTDISKEFVSAYSYSEGAEYWENLEIISNEKENNTIKVLVHHLTGYGPVIGKFPKGIIQYHIENFPTINVPGLQNVLSDDIRNAIRNALRAWDSAISCSDLSINLVPVSMDAVNADPSHSIIFRFGSVIGGSAITWKNLNQSVTITIDNSTSNPFGIGSFYGFQYENFQYLMMHEIGHAFGLPHRQPGLDELLELFRLLNYPVPPAGPSCWILYNAMVLLGYTANEIDSFMGGPCISPPVMSLLFSDIENNIVIDGDDINHINTLYGCSSQEEYSFISKWGTSGSGNLQFDRPGGIAVDSSGNVYVAEMGNHRIQKFTSNGNYITKWGSFAVDYPPANGQFRGPADVAVDSSGNVYVADAMNSRIQKFSSNGTFITKWGSFGSGNGQFDFPAGVAVDSSGNVYVADTDNSRIQKFSSNGTFITKWGSSGSGNGQFFQPIGVAVDSSGNVYVADTYNFRIQKFSSNGTFITKWGSFGSENGQFDAPIGVAVDSSGRVYVADSHNDRIQKFSSNGTFITKWGSSGSGNGKFNRPHGVAVDLSGKVYVSDTDNDRIQKFGP
jgi:DNA-binding beta-propeller fold protein YncE